MHVFAIDLHSEPVHIITCISPSCIFLLCTVPCRWISWCHMYYDVVTRLCWMLILYSFFVWAGSAMLVPEVYHYQAQLIVFLNEAFLEIPVFFWDGCIFLNGILVLPCLIMEFLPIDRCFAIALSDKSSRVQFFMPCLCNTIWSNWSCIWRSRTVVKKYSVLTTIVSQKSDTPCCVRDCSGGWNCTKGSSSSSKAM